MTDEHWFDRLHKVVTGSRSRREGARALALLLPGFLGLHETAAKKKGRKGGKKGKGKKGKGKKKPQQPPRCGQAECAAVWPDDDYNRNDCELKCGQCRIREKFCIIEGDPTNPAKVATCCFEHQTCCPTSDGGSTCVDTETDGNNCGGCGIPCRAGEPCVDGDCGCTNGEQRCRADQGTPCCGTDEVCCGDGCCGLFLMPDGPELPQCCPAPAPRREVCAPASWTCCPDNPPDASSFAAPPGATCCPDDRTGFCRADVLNSLCCPGVGCVQPNSRENCSGCGDNCGPLVCVNGTCGCPPGYAECGAAGCYNTQTHDCCSPGDVRRTGTCP